MILDTLIALFIFYCLICYLVMFGHKVEYNDKKHLDPVTSFMLVISPLMIPIILGMMLADKDKKDRGIQ